MPPTCPKCKKEMHSVCGNKNCTCHTSIPEGELPMKNYSIALGIELPPKIATAIWWGLWYLNIGYWIDRFNYKIFKKSSSYERKLGICPDRFFIDIEECPYCGYRNTFDFWEDREYDEVCELNGVNSLTELVYKQREKPFNEFDGLYEGKK